MLQQGGKKILMHTYFTYNKIVQTVELEKLNS